MGTQQLKVKSYGKLEETKMARISLVFIIILLFISCIFADGYSAEEAGRREKERQLEQVAERFKTETGFKGEIDYNFQLMKLGSFEGNFTDIHFSADSDTTAFRQVCSNILDKILPYSLAKRTQLSMNRIKRQGNYTSTTYIHMINGYRVDSSGFIVITYDAGRYRFDIGDNTFELPQEITTPVITYEDAVKIYKENVADDLVITHYRMSKRPYFGLFFSNIYNDWEGDTRSEYRLCWVGGYTKTIYIDAQTGQVYKIVDKSKD